MYNSTRFKAIALVLIFILGAISTASAAAPTVEAKNPNDGETVSDTVLINATYSDSDNNVQFHVYRWMENGQNETAWESFNDTFNSSKLADGTYNISFKVRDNDSNIASDKVLGVTVNNSGSTQAPNINTINPSSNTAVEDNVTIEATASDPDGGSITSLQYRWRINQDNKTSWADLNDTYDTNQLNESTYNIQIRAVDDEAESSTTTIDAIQVNNSAGGGGSVSVESFRAGAFDGSVFFSFNTSESISSFNVTLEEDGQVEKIYAKSGVSGDSFNGSFQNLENGTYDVSIETIDGNSINKEKTVELGGEDGSTCCFEEEENDSSVSYKVDDFKTSTKTSYPTPIAFVGSTLNITYNASHAFNLTGPMGKLIGYSSTAGTFETGNATSGRHDVFNKSSNKHLTSIDLVNNHSDVTSRIKNVSNPSVSVYTYTQAEKIDTSNDKRVNLSSINSSWGNSSEHIFYMNTTIDKYWVEIQGDKKTVVKSSRFVSSGESFEEDENTSSSSSNLTRPFVQDFTPSGNSYNVTGKALRNKTGAEGLKVVLKKFEWSFNREPFNLRPPTFTDITNSNGKFEFKNVPEGDYKVSIANSSWVKRNGDSRWNPDFYVYSNVSQNVQVTNRTGTLNLSVEGPSSFYYGYYVYEENSDTWKEYSEVGVGNGVEKITLPTGKYSLGVEKYSKTAESSEPTPKDVGTFSVKQGKVTNASAKFAKSVYLNGSVTPKLNDEAWVSIQSQGSGEFNEYFAMVDPDEGKWDYSTQVAQNQNYTVTLYPPYESAYTKSTKNLTVNNNSKTLNFTLKTGKFLSGKVTANGDPIDAWVDVSNYSKDIFSSDETEDDGTYNVTGLEKGVYTVSVYPENPKYSVVRKTVNITDNPNTKNIQAGTSLVKVNGTVKSTGNASVNGTEVEIMSTSFGVEDQEETITSDNKTYSFKVPSDTFYRISVDPESDVLKETSKSRYITEDETIDFTLAQPQKLEGIVKTDQGKRVSDAYVYAYNWSKGSFASDTTDENGSFELEVDGVRHKVEIWPGVESNLPFKRENVTAEWITNKTKKNFTYSTSSLTYLQGKVTDSNGNPLNGSISIWNETKRSYGYQQLNKTDGSFNLTGLKNVNHSVWIYTENQSIPVENTHLEKKPNSYSKNSKTFVLGNNTQTKNLVVTVHSGSNTGPTVANATVSTPNDEKKTNSSGMVTFRGVATGQSMKIYLNKDGYQSRIIEESIGTSTSDESVDYHINQTQQYKVKVNVSEIGSNDSDISPPATVVFVSRENNTAQGGSVTVSGEGERPFIEHLTPGDYLVSLATGPDTVYENKTAKIPENNPVGTTDTVNLTDSQGNAQYSVWYEVKKQ